MKRQPKTHHIIAYNELGELVYFDIPTAAILFGTYQVSTYQEELIQIRQEKLAMEYCALADKPDSVFSDLDAKVKYVNRLQSKNIWI